MSLLDLVVREHGHLLSADEVALSRTFRDLSTNAQRLYVRLLSRRGPLFRADRLEYNEITCLQSALLELTLAGLVRNGWNAPDADIFNLYTRAELLDAARRRGFALSGTGRKPAVIETLIHLGLTARRLLANEQVIRPLGEAALRTYRLLFFGNLRQDLSEFVLEELKVRQFESYKISGGTYFSSREVVEDLLTVEAWRMRAIDVLAHGDVSSIQAVAEGLVELTVRDEAIPARDHVLNELARELERAGEIDVALAIYHNSQRSPARERLARLEHKKGRRHNLIEICGQILESPHDEAEAAFAARFSTRVLRSSWGRESRKSCCGTATGDCQHEIRLLSRAAPIVSRYRRKLDHRDLVLAKATAPVEEVVRVAYEAAGQAAHYVENTLFTGLFGLLFWDVIFAPSPGAFFHPFQRGPVDLFHSGFVEHRKQLISSRMAMLKRDAGWRDLVAFHFRTRAGISSHFVAWEALTAPLLQLALERIPPRDLANVFARMFSDLRRNRSGFPDLILFPPEGGYRLVEVKGPGDTLQDNQKRWLQSFSEWGISASVVRVAWAS